MCIEENGVLAGNGPLGDVLPHAAKALAKKRVAESVSEHESEHENVRYFRANEAGALVHLFVTVLRNYEIVQQDAIQKAEQVFTKVFGLDHEDDDVDDLEERLIFEAHYADFVKAYEQMTQIADAQRA